jgi:hypothetical protein
MLEQARQKAGELPIDWVQADVRNFQLHKQFRLICSTGCLFQHLLERADQEAMLACVRAQLAPEGVFQVSVLFPRREMMETVKDEQPWYEYLDTQGREVRVSGTDHYDPIHQIKHETAYRRWTNADGTEITTRARLALRYIFPQEMEMLLHYAGFTVVELYGDWDGGPLTEDSRMMVYVCQERYS